MHLASPFARLFAKIFSHRNRGKIPEIDEPLPKDRFPEEKPEASKMDQVETTESAFGAAPDSPAESETPGGPWIGVDLDGTLAYGGRWRGKEHIGDPIPLMMERVKFWLKNGLQVKIFTARAADPDAILPIKLWLAKHGLPELEITNVKDFDMIEYWDDRAIQVVRNTGRPFLSSSIVGRPRAPILEEEAQNETFYMLPRTPQAGATLRTPEGTNAA